MESLPKINSKILLVLFITSLFIFSGSKFGVYATDTVFSNKKTFAKGTQVGPIDVSGLTSDEAIKKVAEQIIIWKNKSEIQLTYYELKKVLPLEVFQFHIKETVQKLNDTKVVPLDVTINHDQLKLIISSLGNDILNQLDFQKLENDLLSHAKELRVLNKHIHLTNHINSTKITEQVIVETSAPIQLEHKQILSNMINEKSSILLKGNTTFSFLSYANLGSVSNTRLEAMNILSSAMYKAILKTNFEIKERHISTTLPSYIEPGYEAKVLGEKQMDFVFYNPNNLDYEMSFRLANEKLFVKVTGFSLQKNYTIEQQKEKYQPKTVIQYSALIEKGKQITKVEGKNGYLIKTMKTTKNLLNGSVSTNVVAEDMYLPIHRIVIYGMPTKKGDIDLPLNDDGEIDEEGKKTDDEEPFWGSEDDILKGNKK